MVLSKPSHPSISDTPRKLILLSPNRSELNLLHKHLEADTEGKYSLQYVETLNQLKSFEFETICDAILLDMCFSREDSLEAIRWIGERQCAAPLIALCREHWQLQSYKEVIHLIDDYLLADHLMEGELPTRITHAIRRRLKEQELLHEQALLQSLLDNIPDAIFFKDRESRFTKVNSTMMKLFPELTEDMLGKTDFDLFTEEHAQAAFDDEQAIIRTGEPMVAKLEKETFEGGRINWVNTTKVPLKDDAGRIIGTMGISRNVTELKEAQDSLTQERTLLKTIIEHALAGIFVKDLDGRYILINQQHSDYLDTESPNDVLGKTIFDFFDQEEAEMIHQTDQKVIEAGDGIKNVVDHRIKEDGSNFWLLTSKVPLQDESGKCIGLVGISLDVTEQKTTEMQLKTTIETLESTKLQLIEAEKLKTVGRLAAGVAHEVKNPLNVVSLGAEYLEATISEPEELRQIVRDMRDAVNRANQVIFELLDYASPNDVSMDEGDINELLRTVLGMLRHSCNKRHVTVETELSEAIEPIRMNRPKMEQVFINLVLNAISVMPEGGHITVRSRLERMQSAGSNVSSQLTELFRIGDAMVVIDVIDTGTGLSTNDEAKAFDPFYSSKSTGEGTGLGLSVTKSIVEMHHGLITLENRQGTQGACARLYFPTC